MSKEFFGTDGIRGRTNFGKMTSEIALKVGMAAGRRFYTPEGSHKVVIGKDTRLSGYMLEPALTSGFIAAGMDVILVGPLPTPAIAMLTRSFRADLGVMISASHNPYYDNGIKIFDPDGLKLSDEIELEIEAMIKGDIPLELVDSKDLGRAKRLEDAPGRYIEFIKQGVSRRKTLKGLKVVLDCAHGAAYKIGPIILWELGAEVIPIGVSPNGFNINDRVGSTHPELMCQTVIKEGADLGIALDGDADRLVVCDEKGRLIDGDQIMAAIATHQQHVGTLRGGGVVATTMSNMGLEDYLNSKNLTLHRTGIGDRYVSAYMRENGFNVGGEQSGHIILSDFATTGDGLAAGLQLLSMLVETGKSASSTFALFEPYPQIKRNIRFEDKDPLKHPSIQTMITAIENDLGHKGRVLVRKSGTEPCIRVMLESKDSEHVTRLADELVEAIEDVIAEKNPA